MPTFTVKSGRRHGGRGLLATWLRTRGSDLAAVRGCVCGPMVSAVEADQRLDVAYSDGVSTGSDFGLSPVRHIIAPTVDKGREVHIIRVAGRPPRVLPDERIQRLSRMTRSRRSRR